MTKQWGKDNDKETIIKKLTEVDFCFCYYGNEIDKLVAEKIGAIDTYGCSIKDCFITREEKLKQKERG